jgi:hypothetical protein
VLVPLPLETAGKLIGVLGSHPASQSEGLRVGTVMWDPNHRLIGEVIAGGHKRVKLRALAHDSTWYAQPSDLHPPRLVDIDAARAAREEMERRMRERPQPQPQPDTRHDELLAKVRQKNKESQTGANLRK